MSETLNILLGTLLVKISTTELNDLLEKNSLYKKQPTSSNRTFKTADFVSFFSYVTHLLEAIAGTMNLFEAMKGN